MNIALFTHQYPSMHSNGGAELSYSVLKALKNKNYKISLFILAVEEYYEKSVSNRKKLEEICENVFIYRCDRKKSLFNSFKSKFLTLLANKLADASHRIQDSVSYLIDLIFLFFATTSILIKSPQNEFFIDDL